MQLKKKYTPGDQRFEEHIRLGPMSDSTAASSERQHGHDDFENGEGEGGNGGGVENVQRAVLES